MLDGATALACRAGPRGSGCPCSRRWPPGGGGQLRRRRRWSRWAADATSRDARSGMPTAGRGVWPRVVGDEALSCSADARSAGRLHRGLRADGRVVGGCAGDGRPHVGALPRAVGRDRTRAPRARRRDGGPGRPRRRRPLRRRAAARRSTSAGADLAVVCQARDAEHFGRLLPGVPRSCPRPAGDRAAGRPGSPGSRPACPRLARRIGARRAALPALHDAAALAGLPVVTTLHDATFFTHPDVHLPVKRLFFRAWTRMSLRRARRCVSPSQATRGRAGPGRRRASPTSSTSRTTASTRAVPRAADAEQAAAARRTWACGRPTTSPSSARWSRARTSPALVARLGRRRCAGTGGPAGAGARRRARLGRPGSTRRWPRCRPA